MKLILPLFFQLLPFLAHAQISVQNPLCENRPDPIGLDVLIPRLSWQLQSSHRNVRQTAYEIKVGTETLLKNKNLIWSTGQVASEQSVYVPYNGPALQSGKKYYWQVRVWDNRGNTSPWSAPAFWHMGLLQPGDWKAEWIIPGFPETPGRPSPLMRKQFTLKKKIRAATLYATAHGLYEAHINGQRVGNDYFTPGWTSYNKRLQYQTYDVSALLKEGQNALGVLLGNGWYRGYLASKGKNNFYGTDIALLLQLNITYSDGSTEIIGSDTSWKSSTGAIRSAELLHGECHDARAEKQGWTTAGYNDAQWAGVVVKPFSKTVLIATYNEPVRKHETFRPARIFQTPKGEQVLDFGQNLVGWVQMKVKGKPGDQIVLSFAEVLDKAGNFYTDNLRAARNRDTFILKGNGEEILEPHFTCHGFRYLRTEGFPGEATADNFTAVALYSDMAPNGRFECSNPLINQLQHNIQWGQKGNFFDVPTDCPQRDERLGWTGDAQVFSRTAIFNRHAHNFFVKWLKDLSADQLPDGSVPWVIPYITFGDPVERGATGWADAATVIPWNLYLLYGDERVLAEQYASMKAWVDFMQNRSQNDLWNTGPHFGDWLFYSVNNDNWGVSAITDKYLVAQCYWAHSTQLLIHAAGILGKNEDVATYSALLQRIKTAFLKEYVTPGGRLASNTQTAYVLALQFDMLPDSLRPQAAARLVDNIKVYKNRLTTGFLGTPELCHVLTRFGYTDVAYTLLLQERSPSWLYPVKQGATTIWERWEGIRPDGSFADPTTNSFNHYANGAIGDWMYRVIAGIETDEKKAGYKEIIIRPRPGGGLTHASASLQTYYGQIRSDWKMEAGAFTLEVHIPANTSATIYIPAENADAILENGTTLASAPDVQVTGVENGRVILKTGSGRYRFQIR